MSAINSLLDSNLVYRLGFMLLHSLWEGAAVVAMLSLVMLAMRKASPRKRYAAATAAMLLLIACPIATFLLIGPSREISPPATSGPTGISIVRIESSNTAPIDSTPMQSLAPDLSRAGDATPATAEPFTERYRAALPWLVVIWFAGVVLLALWNFGGWIALQQMRFITTHRAGEDAEHLTRLLSRRLGITRPVRVLKSTLARTPMVIGAIKPLILLPASAITELSIAELESIIAHELAHIRRHDFVINLFQAVVETVLFYHPAVWLISARVRQERENCCDDLALSVTRDRASYVRALAAVASVRVTSLVPAASGGKLLPRLQRLLGVSEGPVGRPSGWSAGAVLLTLIISVALFTGSKAQDAASKSDPMSDDVVSIHGHVFDPQGKPVAGAKITTTRQWAFDAPLSEATSGADGAYSISFRKSQFGEVYDPWQGTVVAATSPGFGPGWAKWDHAASDGQVTLNLATDDVPIEGRILDLEGRPIGGVNVMVTAIHAHAADLSKLAINGREPLADLTDAQPDVDGVVLGTGQSATTTPDGKFRFTGIGRDRMVEIGVSGAGIVRSKLEANTRPGPVQSKGFQRFIKVTETTFGSTLDYVASPGRTIRGTVRDAATHEPLAGVTLITRLWHVHGITDAQGRYQVDGMPREDMGSLSVVPREDQPYLTRVERIHPTAGNEPITMDFDLHRGVLVSGRITNKVTGAPVQSADFLYYPYLTNKAAQTLPEFLKDEEPNGWARPHSHADGTFHIVVLPGQGVIGVGNANPPYCNGEGAATLKVPRTESGGMKAFRGIYRHPDGFESVKDIDIADGQANAKLDMQCDPGITIHVKLVDADGKPVTGARANHIPNLWMQHVDGSTMDVPAFGPHTTRYITILQPDRQLGRILKLKASAAPTGTIELKLEPWSFATGRLVDKDGQPVADAMIQGPLMEQFPTGTGADGHFKLIVFQGLPYMLNGIKGRAEFATDVKELKLSPGETKDLGDVHAKMFN